MYDDQIDYAAITRRVNRRMWRWGSLGVHFVLWIVGSALASTLAAPPLGDIVAIVWFGIISLHAVLLGMLELRAVALQRAIEHERRLLNAEKPKRGERLVLSDDGEVVDIELVDETPRKRSTNHSQ